MPRLASKKRVHELISNEDSEKFDDQVAKFTKMINKVDEKEQLKIEKTKVVIDDVLESFRRKKMLSPSAIKPILMIFSPRDIEGVKEGYDQIDFVDKVWFKYFDNVAVAREAFKFIRKHKEYTHIILSSDDVIVSPSMIKILLRDILRYDFPAISGCCNQCDMYSHRPHECKWCRKEESHPFINVTLKPIKHFDVPMKIQELGMFKAYDFLTEEWRKDNLGIKQVWFQGFLLSVIRRDIFLKYALKPVYLHTLVDRKKWIYIFDEKYDKGEKLYSYSYDFSFAVECHKYNIQQFCDFRVKARHFGIYHTKDKLNVGKKKPEIVYECSSARKLRVALGPKPVRILICTPFNNESHSINKYVNALLDIDYPKELIDLIWFENDSVDTTWRLLRKHYRKIKKEHNYNSFRLIRANFGLKRFGKTSSDDFAVGTNPCAGKNYLKKWDDVIKRGARLASIYNFFFRKLASHRYLMIIMADVVVPSNIVKRYLEVFRTCKDAGWVGGVHHKRYPLHYMGNKLPNEAGIAGPLMIKRGLWVYTTDKEIIEIQKRGNIVFECGMTGHAWMMPAKVVKKVKSSASACEVVAPIIYTIWDMGLKVYCASDIYLEHISLDGKIYRHNIYEEIEGKIGLNERKEKLREWKKSKGMETGEILVSAPDKSKPLKQKAYEEYLNFVQRYLGFGAKIPPRPREDERVMDNIHKEIIDQKQWDIYYGKWRKYIEGNKE